MEPLSQETTPAFEMEKVGDPATVESIVTALREVIDPELQYNIVELGLVYKVEVTPEGTALVKITFTSPACPYGPMLVDQARSMMEKVPGVKKGDVQVVFSPLWSLKMASEEIKANYQDYL